MCGVHGVLDLRSPDGRFRSIVEAMLRIARHRGPDQTELIDVRGGTLGYGRLAIVGPENDALIQRSRSSNGDLYSLMNGEIVNYLALSKDLGVDRLESDASVVLPAFRSKGGRCASEFAGMFAIAIYDEAKQELLLMRDPLGVKPLYYAQYGDIIVFSSEIKSVYVALAKLKRDVQVRSDALRDILAYRFSPGTDSAFDGIRRVAPGEVLSFSSDLRTQYQYWRPQRNPEDRGAREPDAEQVRDLMIRVFAEHSRADVPGGVFVSGGLDSSLVASLANSAGSGYNTCLSLRFEPHGVIDERFGEEMERYLSKRFDWVTISDAVARQTLEELVYYLDEPLENPIHVGTYALSKRARERGIKTVLTGDGSDEFFLGYARHACWFRQATAAAAKEYPTWLWTATPDHLARLFGQGAATGSPPMRYADGSEVQPIRSLHAALRLERRDRLSEYHCMRLDRMTMAHGVEARVPFLDHRLIDTVTTVSLPTLFGESGKGFLQEVSAPHLPGCVVNRDKVHFPSLPDQWVSGAGAVWSREILLDRGARLGSYVDLSYVERLLDRHASEGRQGRILWALLTLSLWLKAVDGWTERTQ